MSRNMKEPRLAKNIDVQLEFTRVIIEEKKCGPSEGDDRDDPLRQSMLSVCEQKDAKQKRK